MKNNFVLVLSMTILCYMPCYAQWEAFLVRNGIKINASTDNYTLLNNFDGPLSQTQQLLYLIADSILKNDYYGSYVSLSENEVFRTFCKIHTIEVLGGPMLTNARSNGVDVWIRTAMPSKVTVRVFGNNIDRYYGPAYSTDTSDLSAVVAINGLSPNSAYRYEVYINDNKFTMAQSPVLRTLPEANEETRIAFGSCLHRWGMGFEQQSHVLTDRKPHALLLMGDIAVQDRNNHIGQHTLDYFMRDMFPAWKNIAANIPVYATWDDHDYFDDDKYGIPPGYTQEDKTNVWKVFRYAWNNPSYGTNKTGEALYFRTRIGSCDVLMLDNRSLRSQGSLLGKEQMQWLKSQLLDCRGPFIILSCGTMWSDYVSNGKDSWGVFDSAGREDLFRFIERNNIAGVLLISGDRHGARGFRIPRPSGFSFYEFGAASMGALFGPPVTKPEWTTQLYGVSAVAAFGEFTFTADTEDPLVTFRLVNDENVILYELTLYRSELSPRK